MSTHPLRQASFLSKFQCLGDACPDTCCKSWNMQLDRATHERYVTQAPELLDSVVETESHDFIMRRDADSDYCVRLDGGLCGIHRQYGPDFLGDACYFYPRVTRSLGADTGMTAALSCPEVARLALLEDSAPGWVAGDAPRLPFSLKNYLPEGLSSEQAWAVHQAFLAAVLGAPVEVALPRIASVAHSLVRLPVASWPEAVPFYLGSADARLAAAESAVEDPFYLLQAFSGLLSASRKKAGERLSTTLSEITRALNVTPGEDASTLSLAPDSLARWEAIRSQWRDKHAEKLAPVLTRWLHVQLSTGLFPFAGLGATPAERIILIGVRLATFKLALMCACYDQETLADETVIRITQSLARILDHLADPAYSLSIYNEIGWTREPRLRGLVEL